jgi:ActR/RegA family two-component response regulator
VAKRGWRSGQATRATYSPARRLNMHRRSLQRILAKRAPM